MSNIKSPRPARRTCAAPGAGSRGGQISNQQSAVGGQSQILARGRSAIGDLKWDERGLLPTIVQDVETGDVLMLAYMNAESLGLTLETGETWFWSRDRQELWHKGATSGNIQHVVEVRYDCDGDALLVRVRPAGPACHTGERTCFYRTLADTDSTDFTDNTDAATPAGYTESVPAGCTETTDDARAVTQAQRAGKTAPDQARPGKKVKGPHEDITYKVNGALCPIN